MFPWEKPSQPNHQQQSRSKADISKGINKQAKFMETWVKQTNVQGNYKNTIANQYS